MKNAILFFILTTIWLIGWVIGYNHNEYLGDLTGFIVIIWVFTYFGTITIFYFSNHEKN